MSSLPPGRELDNVTFTTLHAQLLYGARTSFPVFLAVMFPQSRNAPYTLEQVHLYIADLVQSMADGSGPSRCAVSCPPQHGKSRLLAVRFAAWLIGRYPGVAIVLTGFSRSLLVEFLTEIKDITQLPNYKRIFPNMFIRERSNRADATTWNTNSSILVRSAGSKLAGRRADWLIIDDPHPGRAEAESVVQRRKVIQWYFGDCLTRISPNARILLIGCLTGESLVTMWDGSRKRIDAVVSGDEVAQYKNGKRVKAIVENWKDQGEDEVFEIRTGNHCVKANARHPWLVERAPGVREWVRTDCLKLKDRLVVSGLEPLVVEAAITEEEAWALGFMLGDGWVTVNKKCNKKKNGKISCTQSYVTCFAAGEWSGVEERMLSFLEAKFGKRPRLTRFGYYRFEIAEAGRWFLEHGIKGGAKGKRIAQKLFNQPLCIRRQIIAGFVEADGCITKEWGRHYVYSCNDDLISDFRALVRSCGMQPSNIFRRQRLIQAPHSSVPVLSSESSFGWQSTRTAKEFVTARITRITRLGKKERVYDIQVSGEASFIADGIVSHNTRWHPHDLIGHLTSDEYASEQRSEGQAQNVFHVVNLKAIAEDNDPLGRQPGEPLAPHIRPLSFLKGMRAALVGYEWDSLFQGTPRSSTSGQVDVTNLNYCEPSQVPEGLFWTRGWDTALTEDQAADYTVGARCGYDPLRDHLYIADMFRRQMAWMKLKNNMLRVSDDDLKDYGITKIGVEGVSGFDAVYNEIRQQLLGRIIVEKKNPPRGGKLLRAQPWLAKLEAGNVIVVNGPWKKDFVSELEAFPEGANDDQIDAVSIAWEVLRGKTRSKLLIA